MDANADHNSEPLKRMMAGPPIFVGGTFIKPSRVGGAEYMTYGIVEGLLRLGVSVELALNARESADARFFKRSSSYLSSGQLKIANCGPRMNRFVSETIDVPKAAHRSGARALLMPNYFTPPFRFGIPTLTSILDQQYLHYPKFFSPQKRLWLRAAHAFSLRSAQRVSVISTFVRDDVLNCHGARFAEKVITIPVGIDWSRFEQPPMNEESPNAGLPYILTVSSQYSHKNLETLLRAFSAIHREIPHDLVLVGQNRSALVGTRDGGHRDLVSIAHALGVQDRVKFTGHLDDSGVGAFYRHASAFCFPSLFEGFGMPVVEALGFGLAVVSTRRGSIPEVSCGLATLVEDPTNPEELAHSLLACLNKPNEYRPSPESVRALRERYSIQRVAAQYLAAISVG